MELTTAKTMLRYAKQHMDLGQLRVAQTRQDWIYLNHDHVIGVALEVTEDEKVWNKWMIGYIKETFNYDITEDQMEIFSLFHELGHHIVGDICTNEEYYMLTQEIAEDDYLSYRQIPDEYAADEFAINFLKEHMTNLMDLLED